MNHPDDDTDPVTPRYDEYWERWCGSAVPPVRQLKRGARVREQDGRRWITFPEERDGAPVVVDMPVDAPTGSCDRGRHDACPHRLGGPQEGGVTLKLSLPGFTWRCGCPCHRDPMRAGRLF